MTTSNNSVFDALILAAITISWISGIVLSHGWWKVLASIFPFYAWYVVIEKFMISQGWI